MGSRLPREHSAIRSRSSPCAAPLPTPPPNSRSSSEVAGRVRPRHRVREVADAGQELRRVDEWVAIALDRVDLVVARALEVVGRILLRPLEERRFLEVEVLERETRRNFRDVADVEVED